MSASVQLSAAAIVLGARRTDRLETLEFGNKTNVLINAGAGTDTISLANTTAGNRCGENTMRLRPPLRVSVTRHEEKEQKLQEFIYQHLSSASAGGGIAPYRSDRKSVV